MLAFHQERQKTRRTLAGLVPVPSDGCKGSKVVLGPQFIADK